MEAALTTYSVQSSNGLFVGTNCQYPTDTPQAPLGQTYHVDSRFSSITPPSLTYSLSASPASASPASRCSPRAFPLPTYFGTPLGCGIPSPLSQSPSLSTPLPLSYNCGGPAVHDRLLPPRTLSPLSEMSSLPQHYFDFSPSQGICGEANVVYPAWDMESLLWGT